MGLLKNRLASLVPNAESAVQQMNVLNVQPKPHASGASRSELLVVGQYAPGGNLTLYKHLAYYRFTDGVWLDDKTHQPVEMPITHWLYASEQEKLH